MMNSKEAQFCETLQDIESRSGQRAVVVGIYHQIDARMRHKELPMYAGQVAIQLKDGTEVLLEPSWSTAGIRNLEERTLFDGKVVEVTGVVYRQTPKPVETVTYVIGSCVSPVEDIVAR
jgi:hypothetical protein